MANQYWNQFLYSYHRGLVEIDCNVVVDSTNGNGLGCRSLKGGGVTQVQMYSTAPAAGNTQVAGTVQVLFNDNYVRSYFGGYNLVEPLSGGAVAGGAFVTGTPYVIITMGTTTQAQWVAAGVPPTVQAAVGVSFIAGAAGAGSGTVKTVVSSNVFQVETVGDISLMVKGGAQNGLGNVSVGGVAQLVMRDASKALVNPVDGSVLALNFFLSNSSILINGE